MKKVVFSDNIEYYTVINRDQLRNIDFIYLIFLIIEFFIFLYFLFSIYIKNYYLSIFLIIIFYIFYKISNDFFIYSILT